MSSFWKTEHEQTITTDNLELKSRYDGVKDFGEDYLFEEQWYVHDEVMEFLLKYYDPHANGLIEWILHQTVIQNRLIDRKTNQTVAFAAGISLPIKTQQYTGNVLLGTLLCVIPKLQKTNYVTQFMAANILTTAERGYNVRVFTGTSILQMPKVNTVKRFILKESNTTRDVFKVPDKRVEVVCGVLIALNCFRNMCTDDDIYWGKIVWKPHVRLQGISVFHGHLVYATILFVHVNDVSIQILAAWGVDDKALENIIKYSCKYSGKVGVIDAYKKNILKICETSPEFHHDDVIPEYYTYAHNVMMSEKTLSLPMI